MKSELRLVFEPNVLLEYWIHLLHNHVQAGRTGGGNAGHKTLKCCVLRQRSHWLKSGARHANPLLQQGPSAAVQQRRAPCSHAPASLPSMNTRDGIQGTWTDRSGAGPWTRAWPAAAPAAHRSGEQSRGPGTRRVRTARPERLTSMRCRWFV